MPPWRFSFSALSGRAPSTPNPATPPHNDDTSNRPPSYLDHIIQLEVFNTAPVASGSLASENATNDAPSPSVTPLGSQLSLPTYRTFDDLHRLSISPSMTTLTRPPRYSGVPDGNGGSRESVNPEYTSAIRSGFKSEPWATLRLYDAETPAPRASKKGRHPRFSNLEQMLGNVELLLANPHTIRTIDLVVRNLRASYCSTEWRSIEISLKER